MADLSRERDERDEMRERSCMLVHTLAQAKAKAKAKAGLGLCNYVFF